MPDLDDITAPNKSDLDVSETRERIDKLKLEREKLQLEHHLLRRQLSKQGVWLEWLKAATVPAALIGVLVTSIIGFDQVRQIEENRAADRLDKTLTRLASDRVEDRIPAVSSLGLFLNEPDERRRAVGLQFLVNAIALERDTIVQTAMLDELRKIQPGSINALLLKEALDTAIDRNRRLWSQFIDDMPRFEREEEIKRLSILLKRPIESIAVYETDALKIELSFENYMSLFENNIRSVDKSKIGDLIILDGLASVISILLYDGVKAKDFSGIYCKKCNFSSAGELKNVNFDNAFLEDANFSNMNIQGASFRNAMLGGTNFFHADLTDAQLSSNVSIFPDFVSEKWSTNPFPILECANLTNADLNNTVFIKITQQLRTELTFWKTVLPLGAIISVTAPSLRMAIVDSTTKINGIYAVTSREIPESYLSIYSGEKLSNLESYLRQGVQKSFISDFTESQTFSKEVDGNIKSVNGHVYSREKEYIFTQVSLIYSTNFINIDKFIRHGISSYVHNSKLIKATMPSGLKLNIDNAFSSNRLPLRWINGDNANCLDSDIGGKTFLDTAFIRIDDPISEMFK